MLLFSGGAGVVTLNYISAAAYYNCSHDTVGNCSAGELMMGTQ